MHRQLDSKHHKTRRSTWIGVFVFCVTFLFAAQAQAMLAFQEVAGSLDYRARSHRQKGRSSVQDSTTQAQDSCESEPRRGARKGQARKRRQASAAGCHPSWKSRAPRRQRAPARARTREAVTPALLQFPQQSAK